MTGQLYCKHPIPTPKVFGTVTTTLPQLPLKPTANTKNHRRKVRLMNELGWVCNYCNNNFDAEDLTLDHILPRYMAPKFFYNTIQNWQLLCITCHRIKLGWEQSFVAKLTYKIVNNLIEDISKIIMECMEFIQTIMPKKYYCIRNTC